MLDNQEQENKLLGLGESIFDTNNQNSVPEKLSKTDEEGYFGKPEYYDYSQVELPEDYCFDNNLLDEFNELAGKYNLSQKSANELMSMAVKLTKLTSEKYSETMAEQQRQQINQFKQELTRDREIGGANLEKSMRTANIAYTQFADDDVQDLLQKTGLNCHPKIVKMFYTIGKKMQNDVVYPMNSASVQKENREDILFPTM